MKTCSKCGKRKRRSDFHPHKHTKDRLRPECKKCNLEHAERYRNRPERIEARHENYLNRTARLQVIIDEAKGSVCQRCGGEFPSYVLEFHHQVAADKEFPISAFRHSETKLRAEIAKCDVLCANCHRTVEYELGLCGV